MTDPSAKFWSDIVEAVDVIEMITKDLQGLNAYVEDKRTKWAVERDLAIIGEAVNKLRMLEAIDLTPVRKGSWPCATVRSIPMTMLMTRSFGALCGCTCPR